MDWYLHIELNNFWLSLWDLSHIGTFVWVIHRLSHSSSKALNVPFDIWTISPSFFWVSYCRLSRINQAIQICHPTHKVDIDLNRRGVSFPSLNQILIAWILLASSLALLLRALKAMSPTSGSCLSGPHLLLKKWCQQSQEGSTHGAYFNGWQLGV